MRFIDEVKITVTAGSGGDGVVHWRREKFVPRGGPDGGNGGNGGAVIFVADEAINTLIDFSFSPLLSAENGGLGGDSESTGRNGKDLIRKVPVGTQVYFEETLVADLSLPDARWVAARGGLGGRGNAAYKSANRRTPERAQPGSLGESFQFRLVLKSVADVGLIGLPNVGKSTLISTISKARPEIADYPFTTLKPHLGVVSLGEERSFVVADIPGLIPGAHKGKGLGIQFLKHIERTKVLAQLVDVTHPDYQASSPEEKKNTALAQFETIDFELRAFSKELAERPRLVLFSKADQEEVREVFEFVQKEFGDRNIQTALISSLTGEGIPELTESLHQLIAKF